MFPAKNGVGRLSTRAQWHVCIVQNEGWIDLLLQQSIARSIQCSAEKWSFQDFFSWVFYHSPFIQANVQRDAGRILEEDSTSCLQAWRKMCISIEIFHGPEWISFKFDVHKLWFFLHGGMNCEWPISMYQREPNVWITEEFII